VRAGAAVQWRGNLQIHGGGLIRNVVFDIGWVFVHLDHQPFLDFLSAHGAAAPDLDSVLACIAGWESRVEK